MAYQINNVDIPATIRDSGKISPIKATALRKNGQGTVIASRAKLMTWTWSTMTKANYEWWTQTILNGALSLRCAARLPNETLTETAYSAVVVQNVTTDEFFAGYYRNVRLEIEILS